MYLKTASYITEDKGLIVPGFPENGIYKFNEQTTDIGDQYFCADCGTKLTANDLAYCMGMPDGHDKFQCEACRTK